MPEFNILKQYDVIFHLAALPRIQPSFVRIREHIDANLNQSIHLIELMIKMIIILDLFLVVRVLYMEHQSIYLLQKQKK